MGRRERAHRPYPEQDLQAQGTSYWAMNGPEIVDFGPSELVDFDGHGFGGDVTGDLSPTLRQGLPLATGGPRRTPKSGAREIPVS